MPRPSPEAFTVEHFRRWAAGLVLDTGEPWRLEKFQTDFARDLFSGFLETLLVIPEGNAKTTLAGGLILYHAQFKPFARVPVAASSRDQAEWLYQAAAGFVERSPSIEHLFRCQEGYRRIRCDSMSSRIQVFAADDRTGDGIIPTLALLEELHRHRTLRLYRTWRGKIEKRGGQLVAISTAGEPDGEFEDLRTRMRAGAVSSETHGGFSRYVAKDYVLHEYAVPEGRSPDVMRDVKMANPLKAITIPQLKRKYVSPSFKAGHWRRFVCGLPAGTDEQPIKPEEWDRLRVDIGQIEPGEQVVLVPSVGANAAVAVAAMRGEDQVALHVEVLEADDGSSILMRTEDLITELCSRYAVVAAQLPLANFTRSGELLEARGVPVEFAAHSPARNVAATGTFNRFLRSNQLMHDGDKTLRDHALTATLEMNQTGEFFRISDRSRALNAAVFAVHAASAIQPTPTVVLPSEGIG